MRRILGSGLCSVMFLASCVQRPDLDLVAENPNGDKQARVKAGDRIRIDGVGRNRPAKAQYFWVASTGRCEPQTTSEPFTYYVAPPTLGGPADQVVTVSVDVLVDGIDEFRSVGSVSLTVFAGPPSIVVAPAPPTPGQVAVRPHVAAPPPAANQTPQNRPRAVIEITTVPPADPEGGPETSETIAGRVTGVADLDDLRIVLYARAKGQWFVQPLDTAPFTRIRADGTWSTWTHTGDTYVALLVRRSFKPQKVTSVLPDEGVDVIRVVEQPGGRPRERARPQEKSK